MSARAQVVLSFFDDLHLLTKALKLSVNKSVGCKRALQALLNSTWLAFGTRQTETRQQWRTSRRRWPWFKRKETSLYRCCWYLKKYSNLQSRYHKDHQVAGMELRKHELRRGEASSATVDWMVEKELWVLWPTLRAEYWTLETLSTGCLFRNTTHSQTSSLNNGCCVSEASVDDGGNNEDKKKLK